jgi:exosortase/archaeosortase family protein
VQNRASFVSASAEVASSRGAVSRMLSELSRGEYFAGLFMVGCASGLASRVIYSINEIGWTHAAFGSFGISVIVWIACIAGAILILRDQSKGVRPFEVALGIGFLLLVILPIGPLSWIAVAALSLYVLVSTDVPTSYRGALILLAVTVPMLWSRMLFHFFANYVLAADASIVSWLLGTQRTGNLVEFADGSGQLVILGPCSSLANMSLAFLCWVTISQIVDHKNSRRDLLWCSLACTAVIAVNVSRMAILGLSEWCYASFHNDLGDGIAHAITLALIVGICALGVRRELFQRF